MKPNYNWLFGAAFKKRNYESEFKNLNISMEEYVRDYIMNSSGKIGINMIMRAMCYWCCGDFSYGMKREDCNIPECSIYYWMPYREQEPTYDWMFDLSYTNKHRIKAFMLGFVNKDGTIDRERYIEYLYGR